MPDERRRQVLLVTKGHPFERDTFFSMFDALPDVDWTHVEQPAAQLFFTPARAAPYDVLVLYDMPGLELSEGRQASYVEPAASFRRGFLELLEAGKGFVFLHHALAGWPAWPEYADILGGRFLYRPDRVRGRDCMDSGYRHDVTHRVRVLLRHPVTADVPDTFALTDELYLAEIFEDDIEPLLASDYDFVDGNFYSADLAVRGRMFCNEGWSHEAGSPVIGWVKHYGASPIVYLQPGDGPEAYENRNYRRLLHNAIRWAGSSEALDWARRRQSRE